MKLSPFECVHTCWMKQLFLLRRSVWMHRNCSRESRGHALFYFCHFLHSNVTRGERVIQPLFLDLWAQRLKLLRPMWTCQQLLSPCDLSTCPPDWNSIRYCMERRTLKHLMNFDLLLWKKGWGGIYLFIHSFTVLVWIVRLEQAKHVLFKPHSDQYLWWRRESHEFEDQSHQNLILLKLGPAEHRFPGASAPVVSTG